MELEKRIEIHELDSGELIDSVGRHLFREFLNGSVGVAVAIAIGQSAKGGVGIEISHVASPRVDADRAKFLS